MWTPVSKETRNGWRSTARIPGSLRVFTDDRQADLLPLLTPTVEFGHGTPPASHILKLSFFARRTASLDSGSRIVISNQLWPDSVATCVFDGDREAGVRIEKRPTSSHLRTNHRFEATVEIMAEAIPSNDDSDLAAFPG